MANLKNLIFSGEPKNRLSKRKIVKGVSQKNTIKKNTPFANFIFSVIHDEQHKV